MQVKYLPLNEAVEAAALQNFERDKRKRVLEKDEIWETECELYREEAAHLLKTTGENYLPDYGDHPHIKVSS